MTDRCRLCALPLGTDPIDGEFCCQGCRVVFETVGAMPKSTTPELETDDGETVFLGVDGMHCTTCEAFIEWRGSRTSGVSSVDASYATGTLRVRYDPNRTDPDAIADALSGAGYRIRLRPDQPDGPTSADTTVAVLLGSGLFGMMVMIWYAVFLYPTYLGFDPIVTPGGLDAYYVYAHLWAFTTIVLGYGGWPVLRGALVSLRAGQPNTDLLVAVAATSAYTYSTVAMVLGRSDLYFDVTVAIVLIVTVGRAVERRIRTRATADLREQTLEPEPAWRVSGEQVAPSDLVPGDEIVVRPGERLPRDATVISGRGSIDAAVLTGEAVPETVEPGDSVPGGAVVLGNPVTVAVGNESTHERILQRLWSVQADRSGIQRLADKLATIFVPLVASLAVVTAAWTLLMGAGPAGALLIGLTVLIVACPCALGLATPLATAAGVRTGIERGLIVTSGSVFEAAPQIKTVVLDKTGTLTDGTMAVKAVIADRPNEVLARAAGAERFAAHPIADAILAATPVRSDGGTVVETDNRGVTATINGTDVIVGHPEYLRSTGVTLSDRFEAACARIRTQGDVPVAVGWDGMVHGIIHVGDAERAVADEALDRLAHDHAVVVLTGDDGPAADRYRTHPAVSTVFAGVPPAGKAATIERLRKDGPVAMVGDGTNDAPALAAADLGIAVRDGTPMATDAADAIIAGDALPTVADLFTLVERTNRRIRQNLAWAFVYNAIAIPLAIAGMLNPFLAAVAMGTSSVLVVANSARPLLK